MNTRKVGPGEPMQHRTATTYGRLSLDDPRADPEYRDSVSLPSYPILAGTIPTNAQMRATSVEAREREHDEASVQAFIDNFDTFLQELKEWQPPS